MDHICVYDPYPPCFMGKRWVKGEGGGFILIGRKEDASVCVCVYF